MQHCKIPYFADHKLGSSQAMNVEGAAVCNVGSYTDIRSCMHIMICCTSFVSPHVATVPSGPGPPHDRGFTITLRHTTVGRSSLDEQLSWHTDLYLTTHIIHKRQYIHVPSGFPISTSPNHSSLQYTCRHFTSSHIIFTQLHFTSLHLSTLYFFPYNLHPTTLHFTTLVDTSLLPI
jgi:hypothetical protein